MAVKLGVNGFGRIGRACIRIAEENPAVELVAVNSTRDPKMLAHLLKYDSIYGQASFEIAAGENYLTANNKKITVLASRNPADLNWSQLGVDVVIEATGAFRDAQSAEAHLGGSVKKVIITAPGKNEDFTVVLGVNEENYEPLNHHIISNASCTTNCLAPLCKILDEKFGFVKGLMTTIHAYTNDQRILDLSHNDLRRARAAGISMIPTTTGAARAVAKVLPAIAGKIDGFAVRVPSPSVSMVDLVAELERPVSVDTVNDALKKAAEGPMEGILGISFEPLVSIDYKGDSRSCVVDALSTMVMGDNMVKVVGWYDNEWAYACRVIDLAVYLGKKGL